MGNKRFSVFSILYLISQAFSTEEMQIEKKESEDQYIYLIFSLLYSVVAGLSSLLLMVYSSLKKENVEQMLQSSQQSVKSKGCKLLKIFSIQYFLILVLLIIESFSIIMISISLYQIFNLFITILLSIIFVFIFLYLFPTKQYTRIQTITFTLKTLAFIDILISINKLLKLNQILKYFYQIFKPKHEQKVVLSKQNIQSYLKNHKKQPYGYKLEEISTLQQIINLNTMPISNILIDFKHVFRLNINTKIDRKLIDTISRYYFTKILIFQNREQNIIGYFQVKKLLRFNLQLEESIYHHRKGLIQTNLAMVDIRQSLFEALYRMQFNKINFALVCDSKTNRKIGLVKLKDIQKGLTLAWYNYDWLQPEKDYSSYHTYSFNKQKQELEQAIEQI